jgi:hypothetical protein
VAGAANKASSTDAPPDMTVEEPKSDAQIAAESGKKVELNADGQIVDRRELLSGGLNLWTATACWLLGEDFRARARPEQPRFDV